MKFKSLLGIAVALLAISCQAPQEDPLEQWKSYDSGELSFQDLAPETRGSELYHSIISEPESFIKEHIYQVLNTLYFSPADSIPAIQNFVYTLEDKPGISATENWGHDRSIYLATDYIEKAFASQDTTALLFEIRGVLLHELTHAYQLYPQGVGEYGESRVVTSFVEGMADAVRVLNDGFHGEQDRRPGGHYTDGYRQTGYFLAWLQETKDPDFVKKINRSTLEVIPWSYDAAIKHILGEEYNVDDLWHEYLLEKGDIAE